MATSNSEGKTLALCDGCETKPPIQYCVDCKGNLCSSCVDSHKKVKISRDHVLYNLEQTDGNSGSSLAKCDKHAGYNLDQFCEDCVWFVCDLCKLDGHVNHKLKHVGDDVRICRESSRKFLKTLVDCIYDMEEYKTATVDGSKAFDEAVQNVHRWEEERISNIRDKAKLLIQELHTTKATYEDRIKDCNFNVDKQIKFANEQLSKLHSMNQIDNVEILSTRLAEAQLDLININESKAKYCSKFQINAFELLSFSGNDIGNLKGVIDLAVNVEDIDVIMKGKDHHLPSFVYPRIQTFPIYFAKSEYGYKFVSSSNLGNTIIHGRLTDDIRRVTRKSFKIEARYSSNINIWNMVEVASGAYVAIEKGFKQLSLLDKDFKTVSTIKSENELRAVKYLSAQRFIMIEKENVSPQQYLISFMRVDKIYIQRERVFTLDLTHEFHYAAIHKGWLYLGGPFNFIYRIDMINETFAKIDLPQAAKIVGLYVDAVGNVIVNNNFEEVCVYDDAHEFKVSKVVPGGVRDVLVKDGCLIVTTYTDNNLICYSY